MKRNAVLIFAMLATQAVVAQTPEEKGLAIAKQADQYDIGWNDSMYDAVITLHNSQGEESVREFTMKSLEVASDGDKELGVFVKPGDVKGTAILTYSHGLQPDDQWLYLPELKRVKRISSVNKSGPFVGSEFAFEDISSWEISKYKIRYLRDEAVDGNDCYVLEETPTYEHSGYSKQIEWLDKKLLRGRKIEYFDRKNTLLKTLTSSDYHQYLNHYWRESKLEMINHQTGKSTIMLRTNYRFRNGLKESDFSENVLKNVQ
jgi:hypothetical protein